MARHGRALLRTANHWSLCHDDALDAYQRALEIFLRRADSVQPETEVAWLKVVIKHEALAIRRSRSESVSGEEPDLDARVGADPAQPRRTGRRRGAREPLRRGAARAQAGRAPRAHAQGAGLLVPGDRRAPRLDVHEGQPLHHRGPAALHAGLPGDRVRRGVRALRADDRRARRRVGQQRGDHRDPPAPAPLQRLPRDGAAAARAGGDDDQAAPARLRARPARGHPGLQPAARPSLPPDDVLDQDSSRCCSRSPSGAGAPARRAKDELLALLHRTNGSDAATGVYIATSGGGGRISTIATMIGFCVSGAGAGALCVATGVVEAPRWILGQEARPPAPRPAATHNHHRRPRTHQAQTQAVEVPTQRPVSDPPSAVTPRAATPRRRRHESLAVTKVETQDREFGFESQPPQQTPTPTQQTPAPTKASSTSETVQTQQEFGP